MRITFDRNGARLPNGGTIIHSELAPDGVLILLAVREQPELGNDLKVWGAPFEVSTWDFDGPRDGQPAGWIRRGGSARSRFGESHYPACVSSIAEGLERIESRRLDCERVFEATGGQVYA